MVRIVNVIVGLVVMFQAVTNLSMSVGVFVSRCEYAWCSR